jgi:hypothetical protein
MVIELDALWCMSRVSLKSLTVRHVEFYDSQY